MGLKDFFSGGNKNDSAAKARARQQQDARRDFGSSPSSPASSTSSDVSTYYRGVPREEALKALSRNEYPATHNPQGRQSKHAEHTFTREKNSAAAYAMGHDGKQKGVISEIHMGRGVVDYGVHQGHIRRKPETSFNPQHNGARSGPTNYTMGSSGVNYMTQNMRGMTMDPNPHLTPHRTTGTQKRAGYRGHDPLGDQQRANATAAKASRARPDATGLTGVAAKNAKKAAKAARRKPKR